jgi:hypothetical protein
MKLNSAHGLMCWAHAEMVIQANPSQVRILLLATVNILLMMITNSTTTINNNDVIITIITILFGRPYFASTDTKVV